MRHKGKQFIFGIIFLHLQSFLQHVFEVAIEGLDIDMELEIVGADFFELFFGYLVDVQN